MKHPVILETYLGKIDATKRTSVKFHSDKPESENPQKPILAAVKNYKKICNKSLGSKHSKNIGYKS